MYIAHTQWVAAPYAAPADTSLFAVGDLHGHADELQAMQWRIAQLLDERTTRHAQVVYLGDYIDRGPAVARTLDLLVDEPAPGPGVERIHLVGNHDQFLIEVARGSADIDRPFLMNWLDNGGEQSFCDLGVDSHGRLIDAGRFAELSERARRALGAQRLAFLESLRPMHRAGQYVFVHAGIDPAVDLDQQEFADLLLIREPFLSAGSGWRHPFCVVHGHSISMPIVQPHRIGVDAGCYLHAALCAVQIEGERLRFIGITRHANYDWGLQLGGRSGEWQWSAPTPSA